MAYLDTVQVRLATGLEVGMGEFPDILLDLPCVVVDVLDLVC